MTRTSILAEAPKLSMPERAKFISELIAAVEVTPEDDPVEVEAAWAQELVKTLTLAHAASRASGWRDG